MRKALIRNGIVENTIEAEDDFIHPDADVILIQTDEAGIGWTHDGVNFIRPPEPAPIVIIPDEVALWQFKAMLTEYNLIDKANEYVTASANKALIAVWQYGNSISRTATSITNLCISLGLSTDQINDLFTKASELSL